MRFFALLVSLSLAFLGVLPAADTSWPPTLRGMTDGVATIRTDEFLRVPASFEARRATRGLTAFAAIHIPPSER